MPIDKDGNIADVIMDPSSIISRMNAGRLYEQYFNGMSRKCQKLVRESVNYKYIDQCTDDEINNAYNIILGLLELLDTEQYKTYKSVKDINVKKDIVNEALTKEVYLLYKVSSDKLPYQITKDSINTIYQPTIDKVKYNRYGKTIVTKDSVLIAPIYTMILSKTADNFLSNASAKTNHFGMPIGVGSANRHKLPWRNSPVKTLSETESRLYVSYVSRKALAELKDRGVSSETHKHVYKNVLEAPIPTNIDHVVDRSVVPYGQDSGLGLINNIFNSGGISIEYVPENKFSSTRYKLKGIK